MGVGVFQASCTRGFAGGVSWSSPLLRVPASALGLVVWKEFVQALGLAQRAGRGPPAQKFSEDCDGPRELFRREAGRSEMP